MKAMLTTSKEWPRVHALSLDCGGGDFAFDSVRSARREIRSRKPPLRCRYRGRFALASRAGGSTWGPAMRHSPFQLRKRRRLPRREGHSSQRLNARAADLRRFGAEGASYYSADFSSLVAQGHSQRVCRLVAQQPPERAPVAGRGRLCHNQWLACGRGCEALRRTRWRRAS
jgi:hypothetical protein